MRIFKVIVSIYFSFVNRQAAELSDNLFFNTLVSLHSNPLFKRNSCPFAERILYLHTKRGCTDSILVSTASSPCLLIQRNYMIHVFYLKLSIFWIPIMFKVQCIFFNVSTPAHDQGAFMTELF